MTTETRETQVLINLLAIFSKLESATQGMARYQHTIFAQTQALLQEGKALLHSQAAIQAFLDAEEKEFKRRAAMPPIDCAHCGFTTSYDIMAGMYPSECAACAAPLVEVKGEERRYDISDEEKIALGKMIAAGPEPTEPTGPLASQQTVTAMAANMTPMTDEEIAKIDAASNTPSPVRKA
jgi:predicted Zn-ribbon and HTH transcriptional regulator